MKSFARGTPIGAKLLASMQPMTLLELRARFRPLFYDQTPWFADEAFMRALPNDTGWCAPTGITKCGKVPSTSKGLPLAVDLAYCYVADPKHPVWTDRYFWCRDTDAKGQRVFLGSNGKGLELHRNLAVTDRWGVATW